MCQKIQVSLKSVKNIGHITWTPIYIYDNFMLNSSYYEKCFRQSWKKNWYTHFILDTFFQNSYRLGCMWKSLVEPDSPRISIQYGACAVRAGQGKLQTYWKYAIRISFPRPKWLCERALKSRSTSIACFVQIPVKQEQGVPLYVRWIAQIMLQKDILHGCQFIVLARKKTELCKLLVCCGCKNWEN